MGHIIDPAHANTNGICKLSLRYFRVLLQQAKHTEMSVFLWLGKEPTAVPQDLISQLMLRCDDAGILLPPELLNPGDLVTVTTGPLNSFVAEVEKLAADRRVWVLLEIMGRQTRVAVGFDQLRTL